MTFAEALQKQRKPYIFAEAILLVVTIGILDSLGGWDVSMFLFYALPILLLVWFADRRSAMICAIACAAVWYLAKRASHPYGTSQAYIWATFNRLAYFVFVAIGGAAMKSQREEMRARVEAMERARELEQEIVRVSESEQMRIGQDLHDGLCQNLAAIDCAAACLKSDLQERALPEAEAAEAIQKMLREAVVEARDLARGIFPVQMDAEGLPAALDELASTTNRLRRESVSFNIDGDIRIEDPQVSMHLYRIAQQALSNALQHANATKIAIGLIQEGELCKMTVTDNGSGFAHRDQPSAGIGLRTMQYRARLLGGDLQIDRSPKGGTQISCTVPLAYASKS